MSPASPATARLMETWARGRDIADGLCAQREPAIRLRHIAHLGVSTLRFAFSLNGLAAPAAVITRHPGTGGLVSAGTVKVALDYLGGCRNTMTLVLTGLDIEVKAARAEALLFGLLGGKERFAEVDVRLIRSDRPDAPTNEQATAQLRITVKDPDPGKVGRSFANATMELALAGYAGFHTTAPPTAESAFGGYRPTFVPAEVVQHAVVLPDGSRRAVRPGPAHAAPAAAAHLAGPTRRAPLGLFCGARSSDKGGNANVGLWTPSPAAYPWLRDYLDVGRFRALLPEAADLEVRRYELPNLSALNFVVVGLLGQGPAASTRPDPQAKGLGEYLRSRHVDIPVQLLGAGPS
jgi:hypothetical protein